MNTTGETYQDIYASNHIVDMDLRLPAGRLITALLTEFPELKRYEDFEIKSLNFYGCFDSAGDKTFHLNMQRKSETDHEVSPPPLEPHSSQAEELIKEIKDIIAKDIMAKEEAPF